MPDVQPVSTAVKGRQIKPVCLCNLCQNLYSQTNTMGRFLSKKGGIESHYLIGDGSHE